MLKRTIEKDLIEWKNRKHHPLVLAGLRQTGKTYSITEFAKNNYKNVIYIDLRANKDVHEAFLGDFDIDKMVTRITANINNANFVANETLLILDEIQDCPNARSSLKYWDLDGRYDVIATGSFLGVKGYRNTYNRGIPVGYEEHMVMYPLTFHEFLINYGINEEILNYVKECIDKQEAIDNLIHKRIKDIYLEYLVVGGMPEAVNTFLQNHDLNQTRTIQNNILNSIKADFGRYVDEDGKQKTNETLKLRAQACLDSLPSQLSKEYKKFQYSLVNSKAKSMEKADALQYLVDLGLIIKAYNVREISSPLEGVKIADEYKAYYSDMGLLMSQLNQSTMREVLNEDLGAYKGAITENMIAIGFHHNKKDLYYYRGRSGSPEIDFVVDIDGKEIMVECKSTNNRATSLKYVLEKPEKYGHHDAIKISNTNIGKGKGFITYPLYYCGFIQDEQQLIQKTRIDDLKVPNK